MSPNLSPGADEGARRLQAGDIAGAIAVLQEVTAAEPGNARAHSLLGVACARAGNLSASIAAFQNAAQLQPADAGARFNLANALYQSQRYPEARAVADAALALNPSHENARQLIARIDAATQPAIDPPAQAALQPGSPLTAPGSWAPAVAPPAQPQVGAAYAGSPAMGAAPSTPAAQPGTIPWATGTATAPHPPAGMGLHYQPQPAALSRSVPPGTGLRIARGLGWGALFGQWWTLWTIISMFIWGQAPSGGFVVAALIVYGAIYGFAGALVGLIAAAGNLGPDGGQMVGIGVGVVVCIAEVLLEGSAMLFVNLIFYFFTGRFIGRFVAARVQQPIRQ